MSQLILPWDALPQDRAWPSSRWNVVALVIPGAGWRNLANVHGPSAQANATPMVTKPGPLGIASDANGTSASAFVCSGLPMSATEPVTIVGVWSGITNVASEFIALSNAVGDFSVPGFTMTTGAPGARTRGISGTFVVATDSGMSIGASDVVSGAACWAPGEGVTASFNGRAAVSASLSDTQQYRSASVLYFGTSGQFRGYLMAAIRGKVSASDLQDISASQGRLLLEPRRIWTAPWAGASSGDTGAIGSANLTFTASTVAGAATAASNVTAANLLFTASTITGATLAAAGITSAPLTFTASTVTGAATTAASITAAPLTFTASTISSDSSTGAITAANLTFTASTITGGATAATAITAAPLTFTASTLVGVTGTASTITSAALTFTASTINSSVNAAANITLANLAFSVYTLSSATDTGSNCTQINLSSTGAGTCAFTGRVMPNNSQNLSTAGAGYAS